MSETTTVTDAPAAPAPEAASPAPAANAPAAPSSLLGDAKTDPAPAETQPAQEGEGAKPEGEGEGKPEAPAVPEKYEFTPPEGVVLDEGLLTSYQEAAREAGLTQEQFNKLTPKLIEHVQALRQEAVKAWTDTQAAWAKEILSDRTLSDGKALLPEAKEAAARVLDAYGGDALREALNLTGAGNHPAIVRAFIEIGKAMGEDRIIQPGKTPGPAIEHSLEGYASYLYPSMAG